MMNLPKLNYEVESVAPQLYPYLKDIYVCNYIKGKYIFVVIEELILIKLSLAIIRPIL